MSFRSSAYSVVARVFQLLDNVGNVIMELASNSYDSNPQFRFMHDATNETDLRWNRTSNTPTDGYYWEIATNPQAGIGLPPFAPTSVGGSRSATDTSATAQLGVSNTDNPASNFCGVIAVYDDLSGTGTVNLTPFDNLAINYRNAAVRVAEETIAATASLLANTTVSTLIPGLTVTLDLLTTDSVSLNWHTDVQCMLYGANGFYIVECYVSVNGGAFTALGPQGIFRPTAVGHRGPVGNQDTYTATVDGTYTFEIRAKTSNVATTYQAYIQHSTLKHQVFATK